MKTKITSILLLVIMLLTSFLPIFKVEATEYNIEYEGPITYGLSTVGKFKVNGNRAFCMDHKKTTPAGGTVVYDDVYNDDNIVKCLYYGWQGAEQYWFENEAQGIVYTTLALDYFKNGNPHNIANDFINYVNSKEVPNISLYFSKSNLSAYKEGNIQRTDTTQVTGDSNYGLTIRLQDNVTLVNETTGNRETGTVTVNGGQYFHLEAPLTVNGSWTSPNIENHKYRFQPIVYKSYNDSHQMLAGRYNVIQDPSSTINLNVNWLSTGNCLIQKVDEATGTAIPNVTFDFKNSNGEVIKTVTTGSDGTARIDDLMARKVFCCRKKFK